MMGSPIASMMIKGLDWIHFKGYLDLYFWVIIAGIGVAATCSLLGNWLILRKMVMMGDGLSHSLLPGIVLTFLIFRHHSFPVLLMGSLVTGVIYSVFVEFLSQHSSLKRDAVLGITFSSFFALGILLISCFTHSIDLDVDCVLYGELAFIGFKPPWVFLGHQMGPAIVWQILCLLGINGLLLFLFHKAILVCSFDPLFAQGIGFPKQALHQGFMLLLSLTLITCFEAVGSLLVLPMLVFPGATMSLLTKKLKWRFIGSMGLAPIYTLAGWVLSLIWDTSMAGAMGLSAFILFLIIFIGVHLKDQWIRRTTRWHVA